MKRLSDVTIRARLIVAMALSLLLLTAVGLSSLQAISTVEGATKELYARWLPSVHALSEIRYIMASHRLRFLRAILTPDAKERSELFDAADRRRDDVSELIRAFEAKLIEPTEKALFGGVTASWDRYLAEEQNILQQLETLSATEVSALLNGQSRLIFNEVVNEAVSAAIAYYNRGADRSGADAVATFNHAMQLNLTLFLFALALMAGFVVIVVRSISRPIERITETMHRLAEGDRSVSAVQVTETNEIGRMAAAVDVFRNYLIERDLARAALERAKEDLEEKVELRSGELRTANAALQVEVQERIQANRQLKAMQDEMIRNENLAVIGKFSAGIAHELNQPLAALATLSQNTVRFLELGEGETARQNLERIVHLVDRMGILTTRLRSFARRTGAEREVIDIGRSLENALTLVGHRRDRDRMRIEVRPPKAPVRVHANTVRIEQILVNVVSNAFDATREVTDAHMVVAWHRVGERAVLTVEDNGPGFAPDVLPHIFEPFFTTKKNDGGLGLGLAISADIARVYGGSLTAGNAASGGAVFVLDLPVAERPSDPDTVAAAGEADHGES